MAATENWNPNVYYGPSSNMWNPGGIYRGTTPPAKAVTPTALNQQAKLDPLTGLWKDKTTGAIWSGQIINPDGTTSQTQNGKVLPQDAYGNTLPVFTPQTTVKQPEIAAAASDLLKSSTANNDALNTSFNDYLAQAKALNAQGSVQLTKDQAAIDPTDTINRLNTDAANTTATLNATNKDYATKQTGVLGEVSAENKTAAQTTADRLAALKAELDSENLKYESASQDVANQAWDRARQQTSLYQLGGGTPMSGSGNLSNRYLRSYAAINVPLQAELAARRYAQTGALDAQQQQADAESYRNLINQYAGESGLNTDLANRYGDTAKYTGNLDATTAMQIQQLRSATAGMSRSMAAQYLQQLAVPFTLAQQVLGGQIANLAGIQGIEAGANYYNLNTPYDPSRVATTTTNPGQVPNQGQVPARSGGGNNYSTATATGQPASNPLPAGAWAQTLQPAGGGNYLDPKTGNYYTVNNRVITGNEGNSYPATNNYLTPQQQDAVDASMGVGLQAALGYSVPANAGSSAANDWLDSQGAY